MDRCKLFSQLTKSNDSSCTLFEEILDDFFEEYSFLYGAIDENGFIDSVNMNCVDSQKTKLEIEVVLTKDIVSEYFVEAVGKFLRKKFNDLCSLTIIKEESNTVLIVFNKRGD